MRRRSPSVTALGSNLIPAEMLKRMVPPLWLSWRAETVTQCFKEEKKSGISVCSETFTSLLLIKRQIIHTSLCWRECTQLWKWVVHKVINLQLLCFCCTCIINSSLEVSVFEGTLKYQMRCSWMEKIRHYLAWLSPIWKTLNVCVFFNHFKV